jgi:hypothetical protein
MDKFQDGQRIRVIDPASPMNGKLGTVHRQRRMDIGAWVNMDETLPAEMQQFAIGDSRSNHVLLFPEQCEAAQ